MSATAQAIDARAATPGAAAHQALVLGHADLVTRIAGRLIRRMPRNVELDDLIQAGMVGLLEAAQRYAGCESASFATFATHRIRGAIYDSLRKSDWSPRSLRRRLRDIEGARQRIEFDTCEAANPRAVARALGMPLEAYYRAISDSNTSLVLSFDEPDASGLGRACAEPVDDKPGPAEELEHEEAIHAMRAEIDALAEFDRAILSLYYDGEFLMREIGVILGLTESRVCQIHKRIIERLRIATRRSLDG